MRIKLIILLVCLTILTGCSKKDNIDLSNTPFKEEGRVTVYNSQLTEEDIRDCINVDHKESKILIHSANEISLNDKMTIKYLIDNFRTLSNRENIDLSEEIAGGDWQSEFLINREDNIQFSLLLDNNSEDSLSVSDIYISRISMHSWNDFYATDIVFNDGLYIGMPIDEAENIVTYDSAWVYIGDNIIRDYIVKTSYGYIDGTLVANVFIFYVDDSFRSQYGDDSIRLAEVTVYYGEAAEKVIERNRNNERVWMNNA